MRHLDLVPFFRVQYKCNWMSVEDLLSSRRRDNIKTLPLVHSCSALWLVRVDSSAVYHVLGLFASVFEDNVLANR